MRRRLLVFLVPPVLVSIGAGWLFLRPAADPLAAARRRMARNDMRGASLYLRDAVRAQPRNPEAAFLLGEADLALGNPLAAQTELLRARRYGYDPAAIVLPLGQAYLRQQHYAELLQDFPPDGAPPGGKAATLSLRATAALGLHDPDAAAADSAAAEALAPHDPDVLLAAARIALARGDLEGAGRRLALIIAPPATPQRTTREDALLLQGELELRRNKPDAALARAHDVLAGNPARLDAKLLAARALAGNHQEKAARALVDEVLHHAPKDVNANYLRVILAIRASDYAAADASLQQIGPSVARLPRGFYIVAVTKLGLGQLAQAEAAATQFLAQSPDDIPGLKLMGFIDLARHHPDATLALLRNSALATHQDADTLDLRGRALAMAGDLAGAEASLSKATALNPTDPGLLNRLAAVELDLGNLEAGEADLKHSVALAPQQRQAGAAIVEADLARGDIDAARRNLASLRGTLGDTEAAGLLDAQIKLAALDTQGAEAALQSVHARFPDSRAAVLALARSAALRGDTQAAQDLLEAALKRHPGDAVLLGALLPSLYAQNRIAQAVSLAQAAHDAAPADPSLTAILADAFVHAKQPERATGLLDRASAGGNAALDSMRARILAQQGRSAQAVAALQGVLDRSPGDVAARCLLAGIQMRAGQFAAARGLLRNGLQLKPGDPALLKALVGADLAQAGSPQAGLKAALATAAALRADPANLPAAAALPGEIYLAAGDVRAAAGAFLAAYKAAPSSSLALDAATADKRAGEAAQGIALLEAWTAKHATDIQAQLALSSFYIDAGLLAPAASRLQTILAHDSLNGAALNNLAWIRQRQGNAGAARSLAGRAYFVSPGPETADTLGWILAQQGDAAAALPFLKQAEAAGDPSLHEAAAYHHAVALAATGQRAAARQEIEAALAGDASFRDRDDAVRFLGTLR